MSGERASLAGRIVIEVGQRPQGAAKTPACLDKRE